MIKYTKLAADLSVWTGADNEHPLVKVENDLLARPIIMTARKAPKDGSLATQRKWAASLDFGGHGCRLPNEIIEVVGVLDYTRSSYPLLPVEHFPDCTGEIIWTDVPDNTPPAGFDRVVDLDLGDVVIYPEGLRYSARAVLAC